MIFPARLPREEQPAVSSSSSVSGDGFAGENCACGFPSRDALLRPSPSSSTPGSMSISRRDTRPGILPASTRGNLFLLESAAAVLAALYVLLRGSRAAYAAALIVAVGASAAVVLYRYVNIAALGPIPAMYDPVWFFEKAFSAVAEAAGVTLAGVGFVRAGRSGTRRGTRRTS